MLFPCSHTVVEGLTQESIRRSQFMKKFFLLWFLIALPICILLSSFNVPRLYPLAMRGVPTCGTVTGFQPNNHREVKYSYEVNGKLYSTSQQGGTGEQSGASYCRSGTSEPNAFRVFYLPENPAASCMGSARALLMNELVFIAVAVLILPPFALSGWWCRSASFRNWLKTGKQTSQSP
jgi:Protein of unknown function (DUF3592)